jgi:hypothetical protein
VPLTFTLGTERMLAVVVEMETEPATRHKIPTGVTGRPLSSAIRAPPFEILGDRARRCGKIGSPMSKWGKKHGYPPCIRGAT